MSAGTISRSWACGETSSRRSRSESCVSSLSVLPQARVNSHNRNHQENPSVSDAIKGLKPELVWKYFAEISRIPRCSKHEGAIAEYVIDTAKRLGLQAMQDRTGNIVVKKSASAGLTRARGVVLQGHLDMVCEKYADQVHDFSTDPIVLVRKDNVVMADGTTLGADNGVAVATNLAIMEDNTIEYGPLEFLFTIDE